MYLYPYVYSLLFLLRVVLLYFYYNLLFVSMCVISYSRFLPPQIFIQIFKISFFSITPFLQVSLLSNRTDIINLQNHSRALCGQAQSRSRY